MTAPPQACAAGKREKKTGGGRMNASERCKKESRLTKESGKEERHRSRAINRDTQRRFMPKKRRTSRRNKKQGEKEDYPSLSGETIGLTPQHHQIVVIVVPACISHLPFPLSLQAALPPRLFVWLTCFRSLVLRRTGMCLARSTNHCRIEISQYKTCQTSQHSQYQTQFRVCLF